MAPRGKKRNTAAKRGQNLVHSNPLPVLIPQVITARSWPTHILGLLKSPQLELTCCDGVFDPLTKSVWVQSNKDSTILWRRGFFGKGNLSRSEPSWSARRENARSTGPAVSTAEEVTAKRRKERQLFKLERARALAVATAEAEAAFAMSDGNEILLTPPGSSEPPGATMGSTTIPFPVNDKDIPSNQETMSSIDDEILQPSEPPDALEHLQLSLPEAFFLAWGLDCMRILNPSTHTAMQLREIWPQFQTTHLGGEQCFRFDNPFILHLVLYFHYRSLGWIVKSGLKFCVDYLLYKRGPVFHHAEFAVVLCPSYADESDRERSPLYLSNCGPIPWTALTTVNRVNSQVQKTLIMAYVVIPAACKVSTRVLGSPACLQYYTIREVVVKRFVPARMRD